MINIRTEYTFRNTFGHIAAVAQSCADKGLKVACIADADNTFGHVQWKKACGKAGIKPAYGIRMRVYESIERDRKLSARWHTFIALNTEGLREIYRLVSTSSDEEHFYYNPRLSQQDVDGVSSNVLVLNEFNTLAPDNIYVPIDEDHLYYAGFDNYYPDIEDRKIYELSAERCESKTTAQHILTKEEWLRIYPKQELVWSCTEDALLATTADLELAPMVKYEGKFDIKEQCTIGAQIRGLDLEDPIYKARVKLELDLIESKNFTDYFAVVADMVNYAKQHMLVGPSRGSSAGSLVCYLLGITEIDPIPFGLIFERFIDVTRLDLPDIDIDFPDNKREIVIDYLKEKYGVDNVAHIGVVSRLKPKSAIGEFAKALGIPTWETQAVKDAIIERSGGDARAAMCIKDTLESTDVGREFIEKFPAMGYVADIEAHARHSGVHAAGILVCNEPVTHYTGFNSRDNISMVDKKDAEDLNLLKIDILGLRTLTVLEETLEQIGLGFNWLYSLPLDDQATFDVFNEMRLAGIFQFEGYALQSLTRQMTIEEFNDIVAITSLARPGPLHCGGATDFVERRTGRKKVQYLDDSIIPYTEETFGTIVYQEQVLQISREVGNLSWEDTNQLRKALSKSLGEEFFNTYKVKFMKGAVDNGVDTSNADAVWSTMCTFGSWAFNKSHAVSYGLISYWTAYLKAHHPLEFAVATLNNVRDDAQGIKVLRDMVKNEELNYVAFDKESSVARWSVTGDKLVGGLMNVKGIGEKKAAAIVNKRKAGKPQTPAMQKALDNAATPYDDIFPVETRFGDYYLHPSKYNVTSGTISHINDVEKDGTFIFIGKLVDRNLRDLNEYGNVAKRGGKLEKSHTLFLNLTLEDDTDSIICTIDRYKYEKIGKAIAESGKIGEDFYLVKGQMRNGWRKIYVDRIKKL